MDSSSRADGIGIAPRWNAPAPRSKARGQEVPQGRRDNNNPSAMSMTKKIKKPATIACVNEAGVVHERVASTPPVAKVEVALLPCDQAIAIRGWAVTIADFAESKGITVTDAIALPHLLLELGLPVKPEGSLIRAAHKLFRDRIDATLYRCNGVREATPSSPSNGTGKRPQPVQNSSPKMKGKTSVQSVPTSPKPVPAPSEGQKSSPSLVVSVPPSNGGKGKNPLLFGHAPKRVVMWLGANGVTDATKVAAVLQKHYKIVLAVGTVKQFLKWGADGSQGEPAKLTHAQAKELSSLLK